MKAASFFLIENSLPPYKTQRALAKSGSEKSTLKMLTNNVKDEFETVEDSHSDAFEANLII